LFLKNILNPTLMKQIYTPIFILFAIFFSLPGSAQIMGGDITWKSLGNDSFEITATLYRDCNGSQLAPSPFLITPIGCTVTPPAFTTVVSSPIDVTPHKNCFACTQCDSGCQTSVSRRCNCTTNRGN
jgi:hypothetical protein